MSVENFPEPWQKKLADLATAYGIELETLTVTENDTYTAPEGKAYSSVIVNVSGGGDTEYDISCYTDAGEITSAESFAYEAEWKYIEEQQMYMWYPKDENTPLTKAKAGTVIITATGNLSASPSIEDYENHTRDLPCNGSMFIMPAFDVCLISISFG